MDGKNLILLSRSPDCLALLNRLGIKRINDILKFQELLGAIRVDVGCSHGPPISLSGGTSQNTRRHKSRDTNNQSPGPIILDYRTLSPQANVSSTNQPSSDHQQHQSATSPTTSSTTSVPNPSSYYSTVYASNSYEGVNDKTLINWQ